MISTSIIHIILLLLREGECALNGRTCPCVLKIGVKFVVENIGRGVGAVRAARAQQVHESNVENNQEENEKYYE